MAGRVDQARELTNGTQTNDAFRGRQSRVVLAPVAGVKFAEASRPNRADETLSADDGDKTNSLTGESTK